MIGLAIVSMICMNIFVAVISNSILTTKSAMASEGSEGDKSEISLTSIQTPEQKEEDENLKEQWKSHFNQLLTESAKE